MPRGFRKPKDPWALIEREWRDAVDLADEVEIRKRVAQTALNENDNKKAMKEDLDLAEKKVAVSMASEGYREATKVNTLKIKYAKRVLESRGAV